jgi:hypothetical protein
MRGARRIARNVIRVDIRSIVFPRGAGRLKV